MRYEGKTVLITGAAGGFGRLAAEMFAAEGAKLALGDIDLAGAEEVAAKVGGRAIRCDVSEESDAIALVELAVEMGDGRLDVAINNAGIGHPLGFTAQISHADFMKQMAVNAGGCFLGMKHQLPVMMQQRHGAILNVASVAGLVAAPLSAAYSASKHAVIGLTKTAADEYARYNIRVNALCPSFADTPMVDELRAGLGGDAKTIDPKLTNRIPMGRVARPEEIVQAMLWVCSDENSFMTGQALALDGGLTAV
jgi:NAD(P)-dependent dehydrogenase (short-subunit alcohol dehydrogenase family)